MSKPELPDAKSAARARVFGAHVRRDGVHARRDGAGATPALLKSALAVARENGVEPGALAIFVMGPRDRKVHVRVEEAPAVARLVADEGLALVVHGAYVNSGVWRGNPVAISATQTELAVAASIGATGVVVHLPAGPEAATLDAVARFGPRLFAGAAAAPAQPVLYLEHIAASLGCFETPAALGRLAAAAERAAPGRFGICLDTAHIWSNGVDLRDRAAAEAWLAEFDRAVPPTLMPAPRVVLHLNDSAYPRGAGTDKHAPLLAGEIWSAHRGAPGASGLAAFVAWAQRRGVPTILERASTELLPGDYRVLAGLLAR